MAEALKDCWDVFFCEYFDKRYSEVAVIDLVTWVLFSVVMKFCCIVSVRTLWGLRHAALFRRVREFQLALLAGIFWLTVHLFVRSFPMDSSDQKKGR